MAQTVDLWGATYSNVPAILVPSGNGTVKFSDASVTTAVESDVASGKIFLKADGSIGTGTASGGGGSGLEYEEGTYTPTADVSRPTINFAKSHTKAPIFIALAESGGEISTATSNSMEAFFFIDTYQIIGGGYPGSTTQTKYGVARYEYISSSQNTSLTHSSDETGSTQSAYPRYWATNTGFTPNGSTTRYYRANHTYKWLAVWK